MRNGARVDASGIMLDRCLSEGIAVSLAILVWLNVRSRDQEMLDNVPIPVQAELAADQADQYRVEVTGPSQVPVSFTGLPSRIREIRGMLQHGELAVSLPVSVPEEFRGQARYVATLHVDPAQLHVPSGVSAFILEDRNRIAVTLHRLVERRLPVRCDSGPEDGLRAVSVEPSSVWVRGPQEVLDRIRDVPTQPICSLALGESNGREEIVPASMPLVHELEGRPIVVTPEIVKVRFAPASRPRAFTVSVPVQFLCPANFDLRPLFAGGAANNNVTVRMRGPMTDDVPKPHAYIDLTQRKFHPGAYREPVHLQLPKDYELDQEPLVPIAIELVPVSPTVTNTGPVQGQP
jgi:hypothetical protein